MLPQLFSVRENNILITGASSGMGQHCAKFLAKNGANIILIGRNLERLRSTEDECKKLGVKTLAIVADIKSEKQIENMIQQCRQHFDNIDTIINCAGISLRVPIQELSINKWDEVFDTNVRAAFLISQATAKWMIETNTHGKIIHISSSSAFRITNTRAAYSASKIAVESLTRNLALELIPFNIRVNCIAPGFFVTNLTEEYLKSDAGKKEVTYVPMQRAAQLEEIEGAILLLASNASSYMTGSIIHIDGGFAINKI